MIDSHCHLESKDYDSDRKDVIERCKKAGIRALISVSASIHDFDKALEIAAHNKNFVFTAAAAHPEYIKELRDDELDAFFLKLRENRDNIVGIGECGLDYFWVKEKEFQEHQKELFLRFISLSKELKKPLMVHCRDANQDVIDILESEGAKKVHLHLWGGKGFEKKIQDNGWLISVGPIIATSKTHRKIVENLPLENIMLETDSPWFGEMVEKDGVKKRLRGEPTNIRISAEKIASEKGLAFEKVWEQCGKNAVKFYDLPVRL